MQPSLLKFLTSQSLEYSLVLQDKFEEVFEMKILFLLIVAMMLFMFGTNLTDAKRLPFGEIRRNSVLSENSPKVKINVADYKHPKSSNTVEAQTNEDDSNVSYGHNKAGSSSETHRTFKCVTMSCD
ncbi:hypothetical protein POM88_018538 [Heracleum sosnowskyi]|uniref:Uncharacterized protein n=1 Tax=Heracleum sosnowskyi TaxID=360622 RepID=A0AAD8MUT8_9APIA|nr:hypothetical protein POM88_018538 [Heracleum sosnowskyi]